MIGKLLFGLSAAALAAGAVAAQEGAPPAPVVKETVDDVTEPFDGKEIPFKLNEIKDAPYSLAGMRNCAAIGQEIRELDEVLGPDVNDRVDPTRAQKREATAGRVAATVAKGFIPFGGLIGEVTGASAERRRYAAAVYAGTVRRGFLKGVGLERGCKAPARP